MPLILGTPITHFGDGLLKLPGAWSGMGEVVIGTVSRDSAGPLTLGLQVARSSTWIYRLDGQIFGITCRLRVPGQPIHTKQRGEIGSTWSVISSFRCNCGVPRTFEQALVVAGRKPQMLSLKLSTQSRNLSSKSKASSLKPVNP